MLKDRTLHKRFINLGMAVAILLTATGLGIALANIPELNPLTSLMEGNERFVSGKLQSKDYLAERQKLADGQHPYAIVLACADSRVAPEIIFDESLGKLFVVRTAGEVVDPVSLGSIEYAVEHLHVNLLVVLGHESCGAVKATISGGDFPTNIRALLDRIKPAVDKVRAQGVGEKDMLDAAVKENVRYQMHRAVFESEILGDFVHQKKLAIAGGVYNLHTGKVELVSTNLMVERIGGKPEIEARSEKEAEHPHQEPAAKPHTAEKHHEPEGHAVPPKPTAEEKHHEPDHQEPAHNSLGSGNFIAQGLLPVKRSGFEEQLRSAYQRKLDVMVKTTTLMRDENGGCATDDCQNVTAGEVVKVVNPFLLNVAGRPHLKVRYKRKTCYILADPNSLKIIED